jgi:5'-nucleotidase
MSKRKRILLTNDDGYFSDGINILYNELKKAAEVCIVAPDREQSASSHSLTLDRPLRVHKLDSHRYSIDGTPTDCVMLAVQLLFKRKKPDMIISGVNPSIAVSMANWEPGTSMTRAARFVVKLVSNYERLKLDPALFLNINLPVDNGRPYRKYEFTKLGVRLYKDYVIHKTDPRGKAYYWIGGQATWKNMKGSDFEAVQRGIVSITPLKLNFTDSASLERLSKLPLQF